MITQNNQLNTITKLLILIVAFLFVLPLRFLANPVPMELFYFFWMAATFMLVLAEYANRECA